ILYDFANTVGTRADHVQTTGKRFQTVIGKWIVNRRQNKNVRSGVNTQHISNFTEKLHRLFAPKTQALRLVKPCSSATGNEQPDLAILAKRRRLDSKKQPLAFPSRASKQQCDLV